MKMGDKVIGTVGGDSFSVHTTYGVIDVPRAYVSSIHLEGEQKNVETIISVSGDRFNGWRIINFRELAKHIK